MPVHLQRDLDRLERLVLSMGAQVEEALNTAIVALVDRRPELAERVRVGDSSIDEKEVEIEEECLKILALHQPLATDLRYVVAVLKVNNDLERMGDLAVNIAERAHALSREEALGVPIRLGEMSSLVREMVRMALAAMVRLDADGARRVIAQDDAVDEIHRATYSRLEQTMASRPETVGRAVHAISASRNLERVSDLATNIAEDVIFLVEGVIVRHGRDR